MFSPLARAVSEGRDLRLAADRQRETVMERRMEDKGRDGEVEG